MRGLTKTTWQSPSSTIHPLISTRHTVQIEGTCVRNSQSTNQYQLSVDSTLIHYVVARCNLRTAQIIERSSRIYFQDSTRSVSSLRTTSLFCWHRDRFPHYISGYIPECRWTCASSPSTTQTLFLSMMAFMAIISSLAD